jgi:hypothetical protein
VSKGNIADMTNYLTSQIQTVVPRCRTFYSADEPGHFLINLHFPVEQQAPPPLDQINLENPAELHQLLRVQLENNRSFWRAREGLQDDYIPAMSPTFGYAEHAAWLGLEVQQQPTTSLACPRYADIAEVPDRLAFSEDAPWARLMRESYAWLRQCKKNDFVLSVRGSMSPMELANTLRGDDLFMDFLEEPEHCHRLMRIITETYPVWYDLLRSWADPVAEGHILSSYLNVWMGPNAIGHLSNDTAMLCSNSIYEEFGFPYENELLRHYKSAFYHVHSEKMHYLPRLVGLQNLKLIQVQDDPQVGSNMKNLEAIFAATGDRALLLSGTANEILQNLELLATRNVYLRAYCDCRDEAEALLAAVREHSSPLN